MKNERFVEDAEPYKLYCEHNAGTIYVGDGLPDVPKNSFCYSPYKMLLKLVTFSNQRTSKFLKIEQLSRKCGNV